jgi:hypothetical protein
LKSINYFDDPIAALEEAEYLTADLGIDHCVVRGYEKRKRHLFNAVRADQLLTTDRIVARVYSPSFA